MLVVGNEGMKWQRSEFSNPDQQSIIFVVFEVDSSSNANSLGSYGLSSIDNDFA